MNEKEIILKMISDGKITAEEGAELLEEIEKSKRDYERSKRNETGSSFGENLRKELNSYSERISEREIPEKNYRSHFSEKSCECKLNFRKRI